jgi:dCMP deaminase
MPSPAAVRVGAAAGAATIIGATVAWLWRRRRRADEAAAAATPAGLLPDFGALPRVGWRYEDWKSADENFMDLAYLLARNSEAKDGHMGCCVVRGRSVVSTAINCALYGEFRSDVHAEAAAVSDCARRGVALGGSAIYVTRAPCPKCYKLVAVAGVKRIVSPSDLETDDNVASARAFGIEVVRLEDSDRRAAWRDRLAAENRDDVAIAASRERRKALKRANTYGRRAAAGAARPRNKHGKRDPMQAGVPGSG